MTIKKIDEIEEAIEEILNICDQHAKYLIWTMEEIDHLFPIDEGKLDELTASEEAFLSHFSITLSRFEHIMEDPLLFHLLENKKTIEGSDGSLNDKLSQLEQIGVIKNTKQWLFYREMISAFTYDNLLDLSMNVQTFNKAEKMAHELLKTLDRIKKITQEHH